MAAYLLGQNRIMVSYDEVRRLALTLAGVEEGSSYGAPSLKVKGKLFIRLREDLDSVVIKTPFDRRQEMMDADPGTYYITDHYREYEWMLVRLSKVDPDAISELIHAAHRIGSLSQGRSGTGQRRHKNR